MHALHADTSRHSASFALPPLALSSTFFCGRARVRKQEVRNLFEFGFVFSSSSFFSFSTSRGHNCRSTDWALLEMLEKATGVGGLRAEMVNGVGASFETGIDELVSLDRGIVRTGLGRVVGGCVGEDVDFMVELQLFREVALLLE